MLVLQPDPFGGCWRDHLAEIPIDDPVFSPWFQLAETREGEDQLLERTMILFGSSTGILTGMTS